MDKDKILRLCNEIEDIATEIQERTMKDSYFMEQTIINKVLVIAAEINEPPKPVRHGRWIEMTYHPVGDNMYCECNCSNCNFEITREKGRYPKFCENCGADMREEQGD